MSFSNSAECYVCVALRLEGLYYKENLLAKFVYILFKGKKRELADHTELARSSSCKIKGI